ncbi:lon-related putative ATP-dependent protease [Acetomicrobium thermoterrenum DSM 13490]|uniref:endopeptidase La n=1 Tax=Acetomicrobium thermoterrenum DSM 13490 TaxID=1120987 RepID=A0A1H3GJ95_9BACT|nr:ATP-binding protein [Acetomicrobium thermoterrenum]SDY03393.1 lon-related putative ATP-dependent protease [Acetomicrobium thermoterrenum DSM 13490]
MSSILEEKRVPKESLRSRVSMEKFSFSTTAELVSDKRLIGQERAAKAVSFGLSLDKKGFNIFVVGNPGSGRMTYAMRQIEAKAKKLPAPDDWLYMHNFENPSSPIAINMPAGQGKRFAQAMTEMIEELKSTLSKAFEDSQYEDAKAQLVKEFQEQVNELMDRLRNIAQQNGFLIKRTPQGFVNIPLVKVEEDGKVVQREMQQEEFEALPEEEQKRLQEISEKISQHTLETLRKIRDLEKNLKDRIKELERNISRSAISPFLSELREKYGKSQKLLEWIASMEEDVIKNFNIFVAAARDENIEVDFGKYMVNVFVSNDPEEGAPVIRESNPTYYNLMGKVEYESRQGYLYTDFRKIVAGAIHRANGGYLVLEAEELLRQYLSYDALKRALKDEKLTIENLGEQLGFLPVSSLRPEPIPLNIKVVIVGTRLIYYLLSLYDKEFSELFKIKADFDVDMPRNENTEYDMAVFVAEYTQQENLLPYDREAVGEVIEYASRLADHKQRMTTQMNKITEVLVEATAWARAEGKELVEASDVRKAIKEMRYRVSLIEDRMFKAFEDGILRVEVDGERVGQINGLTVIDMREHSFGHPVRITSNVYMGQEGIVNIEREVKLTGPIHNKGLLILSSYLGKKYAQDMPLTLTARIAFEQTYEEIEGDSASSTELYCLLSSLSGYPLKQGIAVTGSVDQFGNIQPIGGVNEKIEGFFRYCKLRGLTGEQGVMIPKQNLIHLMLDHEVIEAVEEGKFHIWAIDTVDEGLEILTGVPAGVPDESGKYPDETVHGKAKERLRFFMEEAAKLKKALQKTEREENNENN